MHPVEHRGQDGMPEADLALEVQHAHHDLALGVVARHRQGPGVGEHGAPGHGHAEDAAVLLRRVLDIGRGVVRQPRRRQPIFGWFWQVLRCEPMHLWPAFKGHDLAGGRLGQPLEADLRGQRQCHPTTAQQEPDLLRSRVLKNKTP